MRGLVGYWKDSFDWRAQEAALNAYPQFEVRLHDIDVHYLHVPGQGPSPTPLLLMHGWPGSVFEFIDIIPRLTDPARFGGDPADAFTVIAPSLPGFGLSFTPGHKRFNVPAMAACLSDLMTQVLGYQRYAAQGGDIGAGVAARLGHAHPQNLIGIHVNMLIVPPDRQPPPSPTEEERRYYEEQATWLREETGCDRLVVLALLRPDARPLAHPNRRDRGRADGLLRLPQGDEPPAPLGGGPDLHQHPALDRNAQRRPLRRDGAAGGAGRGHPGFLSSPR
jgi:microsomal epoxide hydrolase